MASKAATQEYSFLIVGIFLKTSILNVKGQWGSSTWKRKS